KLVGFDPRTPNDIVVLFADSSPAPLGVVSLSDGKITRLPFEQESYDEQRLFALILAQIRAQDRVYDRTILYTKTQTKLGLSRPVEWTDVYVQQTGGPPKNISACDGVNCTQPALSPDGRSVAFVKAEQ